MALPGKRSVENILKECRTYFTDKKTSCTGKTECRKYFADKKAGMTRKKEWRNMFLFTKH